MFSLVIDWNQFNILCVLLINYWCDLPFGTLSRFYHSIIKNTSSWYVDRLWFFHYITITTSLDPICLLSKLFAVIYFVSVIVLFDWFFRGGRSGVGICLRFHFVSSVLMFLLFFFLLIYAVFWCWVKWHWMLDCITEHMLYLQTSAD
jgi:hypothetical protein